MGAEGKGVAVAGLVGGLLGGLFGREGGGCRGEGGGCCLCCCCLWCCCLCCCLVGSLVHPKLDFKKHGNGIHPPICFLFKCVS